MLPLITAFTCGLAAGLLTHHLYMRSECYRCRAEALENKRTLENGTVVVWVSDPKEEQPCQ